MSPHDDWKVLQALKTFKMNGETIRGGDYFGAIATFAKQYVREGRARILSAIELRDPKSPAPRHPRRPWRETVRPGDVFNWQVSLKLPHLAKPFIRAKHNEKDRGAVRRASATYLDEIGGYTKRVSPAQGRALDYLEKHEAKLCGKMLRAISAHVHKLWSIRVSANDIAKHITLKRIAICDRSRDRIAYYQFEGECSWDREHGFAVAMHRDRVVEVMQKDTAWSDRRSK